MQDYIHSRHNVLRNSCVLHIQTKQLQGIKAGIISHHLKIPLLVKPRTNIGKEKQKTAIKSRIYMNSAASVSSFEMLIFLSFL